MPISVMELHALRDLDVSGNAHLDGNSHSLPSASKSRGQRIGIDSGLTRFELP